MYYITQKAALCQFYGKKPIAKNGRHDLKKRGDSRFHDKTGFFGGCKRLIVNQRTNINVITHIG